MVRGSGSHLRGKRPVSNGADSQLMAQFNVEVDQHLAAIEPVLGRAEPEALTRSDIDLLFREFHSIKGLARVVAADGMERLTHEAESLLSPVRSGDRSFDTTIQEPLIAATDALRDALAEPLGWQAPIKIIEALRAATAAIGPDGSSENTSDEAGNEPWRFLGDDLDLLRAFAELLDESFPPLRKRSSVGTKTASVRQSTPSPLRARAWASTASGSSRNASRFKPAPNACAPSPG
jgi:two-component system chemotaxis sensor kinase CheA